MQFNDFPLDPSIQKALQQLQYTQPTPIQEQAIPLILERNDVLGTAQTGTGKTAAFSLPIIQLTLEDGQIQGKRPITTLIITPTRELAIQIDESIADYAKNTSLRHTVVFGGVGKGPQISALKRGVDILVATPGRLLDLESEGYISLNHIRYFVLDEADRMLDMGFIHDIKKTIALLPKQRQTLFFSATMPNDIKKLSQQILNNPKHVAVSPVSSTADTIQQKMYYTNQKDKKDLLLHILKKENVDQGLVFTRTKHGADKVVRFLQKNRIKSAAIHGNKSQNQRQKALSQFKDGNINVLVATDIAARGIDIEKLRHVINYEIPNISETYVHRIGRSGRAGEDGMSISISEPEENVYVRDIEKLIKRQIEVVADHPFPQTDKPMTVQEKKAFEKEKQRRKQEFFANRKNNGNHQGRNYRGRNSNRR